MKQVKWRPLLTSVLLAHLVGQIAHLLAGNMAAAYAGMMRPPLAPPGFLFGPVWLILYTLMGIAVYRVWASDATDRRKAVRLYAAKLLLNGLWPMLFFRMGALWAAAVVMAALALLIFQTTRRFAAADRLAGRLMLPYLLWVVYMVYLNVGFLLLQ